MDLDTLSHKRKLEDAEESPNKKRKLDHIQSLDSLPNDILYYCIGNFLEIEDVIRLFCINKTFNNMLPPDIFWNHRYLLDFGINKTINFQINEWFPMYQIICKDVKGLRFPHMKLTYAIKNNHTSLIYKILYDQTFKPIYTTLLDLIKLIPRYGDLKLLEDFVCQIQKKWILTNPNDVQHVINHGFYESIEKETLDMCAFMIKNKAQIQTGYYQENPLHLTARKGLVDICKLLLDNGAEVDYKCMMLLLYIKHHITDNIISSNYCSNIVPRSI